MDDNLTLIFLAWFEIQLKGNTWLYLFWNCKLFRTVQLVIYLLGAEIFWIQTKYEVKAK